MLENHLMEIGLSKNEAKIYLALLELGPSLMGQLCGKTKIHRRNVYDSIERLKEKGFASSTIINNRNVFEAVNPQRIIEMVDERKTEIEMMLPRLLSRQNKKTVTVRVYTGTRGRKVIFEDKLKCKEMQYVLGAHEPSEKISPYILNYHKRRIREKIPLKMLFTSNEAEAAKRFKKFKLISAKILPAEFSSPIAINIYGNKTAILLGSETLEPTSVLIEDEGLADDFRSYFNLLWNISKSA
jgi:HTH-type transcriptional regulator, sugar sensing transcriptional regulator